ncbi:MAG: hypothetical protein HOG89_03400 [Candidatus Peribacter sp.]|nr:hypothetical protein [Candidatus Peribacter sp.]MBT4393161.1 hypothetical protein [Candidatus Peribacter sp.]MBT4600495.1 hypothetical protein [Candidatus Peribacter sp.]MBT5148529.1 hypothetical protein [Candidatus Peribacter sp.]MBT5638696.1 hypothetical protein [Candidatus Peribacter sp.]
MPKPIRAIISHFSFDFSYAAIEAVMKERSFEHCAIISTPEVPRHFSGLPQENQEWFNSSDIRGCDYGTVQWDTLLPLDEELIYAMYHCEALFMETVCRQEWKYEITYTQRKQWYLKQLRFWNDYIQKHSINLYLAAWLPHEVPDVVIYHLCKYYDVPIVYFHMAIEQDTGFIESDIEESAVQIQKRFIELQKEYVQEQNPLAIELNEQFAARYENLTALEAQKPILESLKRKTYFGNVLEMFLKKPVHVVKCIGLFCTPYGVTRLQRTWKRRRIIRERNAYYTKYAVHPDLSQPYVYVALHFQPEASTTPMGGVFANQLLLVQMLDAHLPEGVFIYVKEHPKESSWLSRSIEEYESLVSIPRVRLVAREVDTFALREHCTAVGTATGSVGYEALFRSKPVFMFGHRFYQYASGVYRIHMDIDLQEAIQAVFERGETPTLKDARLYLKAMEDTRVHGTVNPWDRKVSKLSDKEHAKACSISILEKLAEIESEA